MEKRTKTGMWISIFGAVLGLIGVFAAFLAAYEPTMLAEVNAGRPDEEIIVKYVLPFLSDIGIVAGAIWAVAAYGFMKREDWAFTAAITANVISLQTGFFAMIPAASRGLFPVFIFIFVPFLITYILLLGYIRRVDKWIIGISLLSGIAFVLSFMNGVASTDKIILTGEPIFVAVQRVNWAASIAWGIFTVALVTKKKWAVPVGLAAGLLTVTAGVPLALVTTIQAGRFSMFSPAPLLSLFLLLVLFVPFTKQIISNWLSRSDA